MGKYLWSFAFVVALASSAMAQTKTRGLCSEVSGDEQTPEELAGDLFEEGETAFKKRRYKKALAKFMCSLRLVDHINTVYNIAQVIPFLKNKRKTLKMLHTYVSEHDDSWTSKEVKKIIIKLEQKLKRKPSWDPETILHEEGARAPDLTDNG